MKQMPIATKFNLAEYHKRKTPRPETENRAKAVEHPSKSSAAPAPTIEDIRSRLAKLGPAEPIEFYIDDPVFNTEDAARILGVKKSRMEKWRQRGQGPQYLRYDSDGFFYDLSSLVAFKAERRVRPPRRTGRSWNKA